MKNLKRIACLVLAIAVVCSLGLTALAASEDPYVSVTADTRGEAFPDVTAANAEEAIYALVALGVFEGYPDGEFKPAKIIERDEFAKIVYYFCGMDAKDLAYWESVKSQFPDIYEGYWAEGYINFAAINGYFVGYTDGSFQPDNQLTMQEAATVLLRVLGYNDNLNGVWPHDYNRKAVDIGLTEYVNYIGGAPASRNVVAQMSYNILDAYKVTYIADKTAASMGYLSGGASAILGSLYTELEKVLGTPGNNGVIDQTVANVLGMINMYAVDDEQFAYMYGRTNEGTFVYYDLLAAAFGAVKLDVHFDGMADNELGNEDTLIESKGWYVADAVKGQLGLSFTYGNEISPLLQPQHLTPGLASLYYIAGGDLTDLGDTTGRVILRGGEAIFAATDGRTVTSNVDAKGVPYAYSNVADIVEGVKNDYYDFYQYEGFAIFHSAVSNRAGWTTVKYTDSVDGAATETKPASAFAGYLFYNMSTGKFISFNELVAGDVLYKAGFVGAATELVLVYNASVGPMTEVTHWNNQWLNKDNTVTIGGTVYSYADPAALVSVKGGAYDTFAPANYEVMFRILTAAGAPAFSYLVTVDVNYVPAYRSLNVAYISHGFPAVDNGGNHGVVTGFTYGYDYVKEGNVYHVVRATTGVTMFDATGAEVTYELANSFIGQTSIKVGDLITVALNADGKINNVVEGEIKSFGIVNVPFNPDPEIEAVSTYANTGRVKIGDDYYTLASDATIFSVNTTSGYAGLQFKSVKLMTAAEFLATAKYQLNQVDIHVHGMSLGNNNTITCLYIVNAAAHDVIDSGIVTKVALARFDGKACWALYMLDGTVLYTVDDMPIPDAELANAYAPALISYKINADGKVFDVKWIVKSNGAANVVDTVELAARFNGCTALEGNFANIYANSVVDTLGNTLFITEDTIVYDLSKVPTGAVVEWAKIVGTADLPATDADLATDVYYIFNASHELVYVFVGGVAK